MKIEEAIKELEKGIDIFNQMIIDYQIIGQGELSIVSDIRNRIKTYEVAKEALEKKVPKKPKLVTRANGIIKFYPCPCCSTSEEYTIVYPRQNYCAECGQKLDWGVEE